MVELVIFCGNGKIKRYIACPKPFTHCGLHTFYIQPFTTLLLTLVTAQTNAKRICYSKQPTIDIHIYSHQRLYLNVRPMCTGYYQLTLLRNFSRKQIKKTRLFKGYVHIPLAIPQSLFTSRAAARSCRMFEIIKNLKKIVYIFFTFLPYLVKNFEKFLMFFMII